MHIIVMGCGRVGAALALSLAPLDHTVAVIDQEPLAFRRLGEDFPGRQVRGVGFDRDTLIEAGIEEAGAFAAVSSGDNSNIISARVARETFGVTRVVARIYDPRRAEVYERLGIPTVATVPWTSGRLLKAVLGETTAVTWRDPSGQVSMVAVAPDEGWVGKSLGEFETATGARTGMLTRFGTGQLPLASTVIQSGDKLFMLATDELMPELHRRASAPPEVES
ncbi:TrkA family potassium uptake protein [Jatrophihabitans endophyticus]|uniref:potassium channel family protein n=1 Tax=Jatrophihabitans endophyticus TaxID=1206085 RepID=UPI0019FC96A5|nr:TrkA family potassium uptake protein [Jatrophihabitans endophyticus]MBE7188143.1 TrkA family potassium uptake protein [Jatrophihabitans endophyticus]